jgi:tetratricopeptide (TPR) repeat protein
MKTKSNKKINNTDISEYRSNIINQIQAKNFNQAIASCESAINDYPDIVPFYKTLFTLYTLNKEYDKGLQVLKNGININNNDLSIYLMLSDAYISTRKYSDSIDLLKSIEDRFPKDSQINRSLANGYYYLNDFKSAVNEINKAITKEKSVQNISHKIAIYFQKYFYIFIPLFVLIMIAAFFTSKIISIALFGCVILFIVSLLVYYYSNKFIIHGVGVTAILITILLLICAHFIV